MTQQIIANELLKPTTNAEINRYVKNMGEILCATPTEIEKSANRKSRGLHIDLPYNVGDTLYGVGVWGYCAIDHSRSPEIRNNKYRYCDEYYHNCEDCIFAKPTIEKFVCTDITYSNELGIIIDGSKYQEYTPEFVFTTRAQAQVKLREMLKQYEAKRR